MSPLSNRPTSSGPRFVPGKGLVAPPTQTVNVPDFALGQSYIVAITQAIIPVPYGAVAAGAFITVATPFSFSPPFGPMQVPPNFGITVEVSATVAGLPPTSIATAGVVSVRAVSTDFPQGISADSILGGGTTYSSFNAVVLLDVYAVAAIPAGRSNVRVKGVLYASPV